jgi:hypothetical protein
MGHPALGRDSGALTRPDVQPIWLRLDFPVEPEMGRIVLRKRPPASQPREGLARRKLALHHRPVVIGIMALPEGSG